MMGSPILCPVCASHRVARADGIVLFAEAAVPYNGVMVMVQ